MKKYYIDNFIITKLNDILKESYQANYIITINGDIYDFADTLKEAKKLLGGKKNEYIKKSMD